MPSIDVKKNSKIFIGVGAVVLFALGIVIGRFLLGGGGATGSLNGRTTLSEGELNTPIASYTYNGQTKEVTAREVIENTSGLDAAKQSDGTYAVPAADKIIGYVRNALVVAEAQSKGITVTDDEVNNYMQTNFKTTDVSQVASAYKLSEDVAKKLIHDAVIMKKYRDSVLTTTLPDAPQAPTETTSQEYAQYIIGLAGDEWDAKNNTWASQDGDYYKQLSAYSISNDSASYAAAQTAYQVAMSKYSAVASKASQEWSQKINEILGKASIAVYSLAL